MAADRRAALLVGFAFAALFVTLSYLRFSTFHNRTFDLAFYARMSWGEAHFDGWQPILSASVWGLHLVWVLELCCWVGELFGHVPTLLGLQALALALAAVPLSSIAARHVGARLPGHARLVVVLATASLFVHPNLSHVASEDFHPGTLAVLPLAWLVHALDRKNAPALALASALVVSCREDLGLVAAVAAFILAYRSEGRPRRIALVTALACLAYVALFALVLLPAFGPAEGSLALHFGHLDGGGSSTPAGLAVDALSSPGRVLSHLATPARLLYLPTMLAPLALLPLLCPELLLVAAPVLGIALFSRFPTATHLDSHYFTPALPILVAGAWIGLGRLLSFRPTLAAPAIVLPLAVCLAVTHVAAGGTPVALAFDRRAYVEDANTEPARRIVALVAQDASVQAPDALLAHFAERIDLRRAPPPETLARYVVLDLRHRRRLAHDEDLLRTDEEPNALAWLSRDDHALLALGGDYALLERGRTPRDGIGFASVRPHVGPLDEGRALTRCLRLLDARRIEDRVELDLLATEPCPADLGIRLGVGHRPRRVDLIAEGALPPALLAPGDRVRSVHTFSSREWAAIERDGLRVGALRSSGAPPEHGDPPALDVPL